MRLISHPSFVYSDRVKSSCQVSELSPLRGDFLETLPSSPASVASTSLDILIEQYTQGDVCRYASWSWLNGVTGELAVCCELIPDYLLDEDGTKIVPVPIARNSNN